VKEEEETAPPNSGFDDVRYSSLSPLSTMAAGRELHGIEDRTVDEIDGLQMTINEPDANNDNESVLLAVPTADGPSSSWQITMLSDVDGYDCSGENEERNGGTQTPDGATLAAAESSWDLSFSGRSEYTLNGDCSRFAAIEQAGTARRHVPKGGKKVATAAKCAVHKGAVEERRKKSETEQQDQARVLNKQKSNARDNKIEEGVLCAATAAAAPGAMWKAEQFACLSPEQEVALAEDEAEAKIYVAEGLEALKAPHFEEEGAGVGAEAGTVAVRTSPSELISKGEGKRKQQQQQQQQQQLERWRQNHHDHSCRHQQGALGVVMSADEAESIEVFRASESGAAESSSPSSQQEPPRTTLANLSAEELGPLKEELRAESVEQSTKAAQGAFKTRREDELAPTAELQIEDPAAEARVQQAVGGAIADTLAETAAAEQGRWQLRLDEAVSAEQAKAKAAAEAADAATLDAAAAAAKDVAEQERQLETAMRSLAAARDKAMVQSEALAASEAAAKQLGEQAAMAEARVRSVTEELHLSRAVRGDHEEKDSCIKGLVEEGKKLSEQVGHMQKMVREKNAKIEDAEKEAKRLAKERHALAASVDDLTEQLQLLKSQTGDKTKSLAAMQAVSQASSDKLSTVEQKLRATREEVGDLKTALDSAWAAEKLQKREVHGLRAENEALKVRLRESTERTVAQAEEERDQGQREALLLATQRKLQGSLTRHQHEAALREEVLRGEVNDMRRRWQDATSRSEEIAADVHESTAPLLRQIRALQDEGRARAQAWASAEASFMERAVVAEDAAQRAEVARRAADEHAVEVEMARRAVEEQVRDAKSGIAVANADCRAAVARATAAEDRVRVCSSIHSLFRPSFPSLV